MTDKDPNGAFKCLTQKKEHVFTRGDLLRNYQTLESIASQLPPPVLEADFPSQVDCLVGTFENYLQRQYADDHHHCSGHEHHHHSHDHENDFEKSHFQDHSNCHVDPWEEEKQLDLMLVDYRQRLQAAYKPLHPMLYDIENWKISPKLKSLLEQHPAHLKLPIPPVQNMPFPNHPLIRLMPIVSNVTEKETPSGLIEEIKSCFEEVHPGVFVFEFLDPQFCETLLEEISYFEKWCESNQFIIHRPNSMNNYGVILDNFGFEPILEQLISQYLNSLSSIFYPYIGATLDHHHGFVVTYEMGKDEKLDFHVDDADVTLNVCLGKSFSKGELYFAGVRCSHHQSTSNPYPGEEFVLQHHVGQAVLHVGRHRHAAFPIASGERMNLILWCRSSRFRRFDQMFDCPDWCAVAIKNDEAQKSMEAQENSSI